MVHLVYHPHFAAKKKFLKLRVCFGLQFGALRFSPHKDQEQNHARDPEGLQLFFSDHGTKKGDSKHRGLVANIN